MLRLFSYKLTHDTGFAPNPFFGILTLATCKPRIRKVKEEGDWIAGFTSQQLCPRDSVGEERLVYLMEVNEKIPFSRYFFDPRFLRKIPDLQEPECIYKAGDNIYRPLCQRPSDIGDFEQLPNPYHKEKDKQKDLSGKYVLASDRFFYFGGDAVPIPGEVRPEVPKGQSAHGSLTHDQMRAHRFLDYVLTKYTVGVHGAPHKWPEGDLSWRCRSENYLQ
jgi:hypothetical protein